MAQLPEAVQGELAEGLPQTAALRIIVQHALGGGTAALLV